MQYNKNKNGKYTELTQKNVDTGMGVERTIAVLNNLSDNYQTDIFLPIIQAIENISGKKYNESEEIKKAMRIIADHIRAAVFILGDKHQITPSNIEHGYVLRRLIRRAIRYGRIIGIKNEFTDKIAEAVIPIYSDYPELKKSRKFILDNLKLEEEKFSNTIEQGLRKFHQLKGKNLNGKDAFLLFQSYGFPIEMTLELAEEEGIKVNIEEYESELKKHQELSRTSSEGRFKSGLADNSEKTTRLHTATHLLNEALRIVLKDNNIKQKGSNINSERLRFDFNFPRKLEENEIKEIETLINKKISESLEVIKEEMSISKAINSGAQAEFGAKYPRIVSVYAIGNFSREICTGPHVKNTKDIGHFKIIKEEGVAAGIRRIKAVVE